VTPTRTDPMRKLYRAAGVIGPAGIVLLLAVAYADRAAAFASYLSMWWFLLALPLGSMAVLCVHNLTGGAWGERIRLPLERALSMLPVTLLLSIPLWFGLPVLYAWARPDEVSASPLLQAKVWYLAPPLFAARAAIVAKVRFQEAPERRSDPPRSARVQPARRRGSPTWSVRERSATALAGSRRPAPTRRPPSP